ncbi:hypothetical protein MJO28_002096 [Puccinia striiformis f. sp. tritici]|uniref:Uncharacterized protein n=1 Tax=Puccinia striiformis f. sp. tritici TaxID=168172 RepID=A0ACC0EW06_9BASI|nr:hypothetical protein MJO28_002096 [Puccinia striiformis f. sp. tritici]
MELGRLSGGVLTLVDEYPLTKKYQNRKIAPTILIVSILGFIGLVFFNLSAQGKVNTTVPFPSPRFVHQASPKNGENITSCQPSHVGLDASIFTIPPTNQSEDLDQSFVSPGLFQWNVYALTGQTPDISTGAPVHKTMTGFLYSAGVLNCTMVRVSSSYRFQSRTFSFEICATCVFPNSRFTIELCTSYDSSSRTGINSNSYTRDGIENTFGRRFDDLHDMYERLTIPPYSFQLLSFPPGYNDTQDDSNQRTQINRTQVSRLKLGFAGIKLTPPAIPQGIPYTTDTSWVQSPEGMITLDHSTNRSATGEDMYLRDTPVSNILDAYKATELAGSSEFGITVIGIGDLYPLRNNRSLSTLPEVLQSMFNHTLNTNSFLINTAATELQGSEIAAIYLCINTRKQWMPFLQVLSATLGSSMGVFAAAFSVIVMLARRFDSRHKKEEDRVRRSESIRNTSISNVREGEEIPLTKITEQD